MKRTQIEYRQAGLGDAPPRRCWSERWAVLAAGAAILLALIASFAGRSAAVVLASLPIDGCFIILWLLAAAGYGSIVARSKPDQSEGSLRAISTLAIGMGILSLIQLVAGLVGELHRLVAYAIIAAGVGCFLFRIRRLQREHLVEFFRVPANFDWLWLLILPVLAMMIVAAYVPPGILWGDEPHGYDVLEYHLQLPREFYELHRIVPLHHNVFSFFPMNVEMHYLLALQLRAGAWNGMYLAQLMHVTFVCLSLFAIYVIARRFGDKFTCMLATIAAAYVPWMTLLGPVAYNEGGLLLFGTLAIGWLVHILSQSEWRQEKQPDAASFSYRPWMVGGAFAGFACGVKLTGVPQVLVLAPLALFITSFIVRRAPARVLLGCCVYVITGLLVFSPWLIRTAVAAGGNPVFPEAQSVLGRAHFSAPQTERWHRAHSPTPKQQSLRGRLVAARDQILLDWRYGWIFLPLGLYVCYECFRRPQARLIPVLIVLYLLFWLGFTHLQGRFFTLTIPVAMLALALPKYRWQQIELTMIASVALVAVCLGTWRIFKVFNERVSPLCEREILGATQLIQMLPDDVQDVLTRRSDPVALAGDARAFLYQMPMSRLHYRTVFDVDAKPGEDAIACWVSGLTGSPWIIVDQSELQRFHQTYFGIPVPTRTDRSSDVFILEPAGH